MSRRRSDLVRRPHRPRTDRRAVDRQDRPAIVAEWAVGETSLLVHDKEIGRLFLVVNFYDAWADGDRTHKLGLLHRVLQRVLVDAPR